MCSFSFVCGKTNCSTLGSLCGPFLFSAGSYKSYSNRKGLPLKSFQTFATAPFPLIIPSNYDSNRHSKRGLEPPKAARDDRSEKVPGMAPTAAVGGPEGLSQDGENRRVQVLCDLFDYIEVYDNRKRRH